MKQLILITLPLLFFSSIVIAQQNPVQNQTPPLDSLDKKLKIKQLEVLEKELDLKMKEYDLKAKTLDIEQQRFDIEKIDRIEEKKEQEEQDRLFEVEKKKRLDEAKKKEEESNRYKNFSTLVFFEPLPLFIGTFQGGIEKKILEKRTLRLSMGYNYSEDPLFYQDTRYTKGIKLEVQYRNYLSREKSGAEGFYVGAYGMFKTLERNVYIAPISGSNTFIQSQDYIINGRCAGLGVLIGYNIFVIERLTLDLFMAAGMNFKLNSYETKDLSVQLINPYANGTVLRMVGVSLGLPIRNK